VYFPWKLKKVIKENMWYFSVLPVKLYTPVYTSCKTEYTLLCKGKISSRNGAIQYIVKYIKTHSVGFKVFTKSGGPFKAH
jgi:hypothetical protein